MPIGHAWKNCMSDFHVRDEESNKTYKIENFLKLDYFDIDGSKVEFEIETDGTATVTKILKTKEKLYQEQIKYYEYLDTLPISKIISIFKNKQHYAEISLVLDKNDTYIRLFPLGLYRYEKINEITIRNLIRGKKEILEHYSLIVKEIS